MNSRALPHIAALFTMAVWGVTFVSTKVLLTYLDPLEILATRTILGFITLAILRPRILRLQQKSHELFFAAAGLTGSFLYYLAENIALEYADASFVSVAVSTAPLFTAILGFVVLKEHGARVRFFVGFVIAMAGIMLISFQGGPGYASPLGLLLCLLAAFSWAIYSIIIKHISNLGYETVATTKRVFAWGLVYMALAWLVRGKPVPLEAFMQPIVWGNLAFLGILASAICFVTWGYSVKHLGATSASAYIYLQAPLTVVWAVLLLGDPFTAPIFCGIVLVIGGLVLSEDWSKATKQRPESS